MQFVYVVGHRNKKDLRLNLFMTAQQELPETIVLLYDPKRSFGLDRAIHAQQNALLAGDPFQRFRPLLHKSLGNLYLTVFLRLYAAFLIRAAGTVVALIVCDPADIAGCALRSLSYFARSFCPA